MLHLIHEISAVRLYLPKDLRPLDNRQSVGKSIQVQHVLTSAFLGQYFNRKEDQLMLLNVFVFWHCSFILEQVAFYVFNLNAEYLLRTVCNIVIHIDLTS